MNTSNYDHQAELIEAHTNIDRIAIRRQRMEALRSKYAYADTEAYAAGCEEARATTHIIHASGRTEMEDHQARSYTVIECHYNEGVVVTYDPYKCPVCNQNPHETRRKGNHATY